MCGERGVESGLVHHISGQMWKPSELDTPPTSRLRCKVQTTKMFYHNLQINALTVHKVSGSRVAEYHGHKFI